MWLVKMWDYIEANPSVPIGSMRTRQKSGLGLLLERVSGTYGSIGVKVRRELRRLQWFVGRQEEGLR
jgi:hypothetical protein